MSVRCRIDRPSPSPFLVSGAVPPCLCFGVCLASWFLLPSSVGPPAGSACRRISRAPAWLPLQVRSPIAVELEDPEETACIFEISSCLSVGILHVCTCERVWLLAVYVDAMRL